MSGRNSDNSRIGHWVVASGQTNLVQTQLTNPGVINNKKARFPNNSLLKY